MEEKSLDKQLDEKVEQILATNTVSKAQEIMSSKRGSGLVAAVAFFEAASPIPIITDPFIVAAILLNRAEYLRTVFISTAFSVLGGLVAYFTAIFFFDYILNSLSPEAALALASIAANQENTFIITLIGAFTPVPYTFSAWTVGALAGNVWLFILGSILGRGGRYFILGWLTYRFGPAALKIAKRYIGITSIILIIGALTIVWLKM